MITHFNSNSKLIYDIDEVDCYLSKIKNKNLLKLNQSEIDDIKKIILKLDQDKEIKKGNEFILIDKK